MKAAVIVFPGSNCDRDIAVALQQSLGKAPDMVWHGSGSLPAVDLIVLPGGFSYGDYLRSGAMAAHSPIMKEVVAKAKAGVPVLGVCNGFQMLTEAKLLPGVLMRNAGLKFICKSVPLRVERSHYPFTAGYDKGAVIHIPIAHNEGNYTIDGDGLKRLQDQDQIVFRYCDAAGQVTPESNPNGAQDNIAGIVNEKGTVLGMMPHPERVVDPLNGGLDGRRLFDGLVEALS